ncbi:hypothetical protein CF392_15880 [Tamilnaduibacter salinus]|uniref:Sulfotransferase family protein n=1 Tax=Tamilnaduibacter salinus TaxID=1484056 RepID=A0A2A2HYZ0_9GAMM|nr:hypothetical protein CF392_15880 [Tamilnaduibacter salinus]
MKGGFCKGDLVYTIFPKNAQQKLNIVGDRTIMKNNKLDQAILERYGLLPRFFPPHFNIKASNLMRRQRTIHKEFYEKKMIYIHIPKVAGSSIGEAILGHDKVGHYPARYIRDIDNRFFDEAYKFTFVRNPWDRLYSAFSFLKNGGKGTWDSDWTQKYRVDLMDFEEFVIDFINESTVYSIIHLVPQIDFVLDKHGNSLMDYIGYFEELEEGMSVVSESTGFNFKVPRANVNEKVGYRDVYSKKMIDKVARVYQEDLNYLRYDFA